MFSVFLSNYSNNRESLGELEKAVETQHFSFSQTSTRVSITRWKLGTCFLFLKCESCLCHTINKISNEIEYFQNLKLYLKKKRLSNEISKLG